MTLQDLQVGWTQLRKESDFSKPKSKENKDWK